jgi:hypothetical protein
VRAAQILLENMLKVTGDDLDQRIEKLEEAWLTGQHEPSGPPELRALSG